MQNDGGNGGEAGVGKGKKACPALSHRSANAFEPFNYGAGLVSPSSIELASLVGKVQVRVSYQIDRTSQTTMMRL